MDSETQDADELTASGGSSHMGNETSNFDCEAQVTVERVHIASRGARRSFYVSRLPRLGETHGEVALQSPKR